MFFAILSVSGDTQTAVSRESAFILLDGRYCGNAVHQYGPDMAITQPGAKCLAIAKESNNFFVDSQYTTMFVINTLKP